MEIYAAAKREQTAQVRQRGTAARSTADAAAGELEAKLDQFQRTREAISQLEAQAREAEEKIRQAAARLAYESSQKAAQEGGEEELEALGEQLKMMMRCQEIARRLMAGDKVPPEDEQYLMTNDPNGYKLALAARKPKQDPKEWESVLKDDQSPQEESAQGEDVRSSGPAARSGDRGEAGGGRAGGGDSGGG